MPTSIKFILPFIALLSLGLTGCQNMGGNKEMKSHKHGEKHHKMHMKGAMKAMKEANKAPLVAQLKGTKNRTQVSGDISFTPSEDGLTITGEITGLKPNATHGFHVHQYGDCSADDATSAGGHYNPAGADHSLPDSKKRHAGDLGNIKSNGKGVAMVDIQSDLLVPIHGRFPVAGRALIVHAQPDTGKGDTGEAGARIACGVVGFTQAE